MVGFFDTLISHMGLLGLLVLALGARVSRGLRPICRPPRERSWE
jgi:hypothetical protein